VFFPSAKLSSGLFRGFAQAALATAGHDFVSEFRQKFHVHSRQINKPALIVKRAAGTTLDTGDEVGQCSPSAVLASARRRKV